jgi:uncharacterized protein (DUF433 family)
VFRPSASPEGRTAGLWKSPESEGANLRVDAIAPAVLLAYARQACIRGQRVTVGMIVGQIGAGRTIDELLGDYPYLERADILDALRYAAWRAQEREVDLARAS